MKLYSNGESFKIYHGDMLDMLEVVEENSVDSIVCDPPYGLTSITKRFGSEDSSECKYARDGSFQRLSRGFMGKTWDGSGIEYNVDAWKKCYDVLKPGGYLLAFGGSRTFYRIACAIEDAGFEIRDTIMWLYGSGFPKSMNIGLMLDKRNGVESEVVGTSRSGASSRAYQSEETTTAGEYEIRKARNEWNGWGTALKPAFEPIIVARKPFKGSLIDNIIENGVGGINIDECRIGDEARTYKGMSAHKPEGAGVFRDDNWEPKDIEVSVNGRFPANTILTYDETDFDEVCGGFPNTKGGKRHNIAIRKSEKNSGYGFEVNTRNEFDDSGSASRYFYCAKASKKDRDEGLDMLETKKTGELQGGRKEGSAGSIMLNTDGTTRVNPYAGTGAPKKNIHPTVKPTELMQYLVRLVTPNGGVVLDPFMGSGSTGKAVMYENKERNKDYKFIGIELTDEYLPIAHGRISYVCGNGTICEVANEEEVVQEISEEITPNDLFNDLD